MKACSIFETPDGRARGIRLQRADGRQQPLPAGTAAGHCASARRGWADIAQLARAQFAGLVSALRAAGATVCVARDSAEPVKPDAVFPNNWVSFHDDGTVVLYPMQSENRRIERREAVVEQAKLELGFVEKRRIDLTAEERHGRFLEGTGSLVLDRRRARGLRLPLTAHRRITGAQMGAAHGLRTGALRCHRPGWHAGVSHQRAAVDWRAHCRRGTGLGGVAGSRQAVFQVAGRRARCAASGWSRAAVICRQHARSSHGAWRATAGDVGSCGSSTG